MSETTVSFGLGSWIFVQVVLFVIHYGFDKTLPWWVLWFPTLIVGIIIAFVLIIALIILIGVALSGEY